MLKSRATAGAAAILVVLFTLILLAAILVVSSRLSLSSLQTNADQASTLEAQYAAESNMNYARSVLSDLQGLMGEGSLSAGKTTVSEIRQAVADFCGRSTFAEVVFTAAPDYMRADLTDRTARDPDPTVCNPVLSAGTAGKVLARYVKPEAYSQFLKAGEVPTDKLVFWNDLFANYENTLTQDGKNRFKLEPLGVMKINDARYRFFVGVGDKTASKGTQAGAARVLSAKNNVQNGVWWFELQLPSLTRWVLFTNHHRSSSDYTAPDVNFASGQVFDGDLHTNEKVRFNGSGVTTRFRGKLTSAGCTNLPTQGSPSGGECTQQAGVYLGANLKTPTYNMTQQQGNEYLQRQTPNVSWPSESKLSPDFYADYIPLPENANDQRASAISGGLVVPDDISRVQMMAGTENSSGQIVTLNSYNATAKKWSEPANTYQYIRYFKDVTSVVYQCSFDYGATYQDTYSYREARYLPNSTWNSTNEELRSRIVENNRYRYIIANCRNNSLTNKVLSKEFRIDKDGKINFRERGSNGAMGAWQTDPNKPSFNGVIYGSQVNDLVGPERIGSTIGDVSSTQRVTYDEAPPALASFSQITVASEGAINVSSDLTLSDTPCDNSGRTAGSPSTDRSNQCAKTPKPQNVLGLYSQANDVTITTAAPDDVNLHAVLMTSTGRVKVDDHASRNRGYRGQVHLVGGLVENWYGIFGLADGSAGYLRNFTYDPRLKEGILPPYFPVSPTWEVEFPDPRNRGLANLIITNQQASDFK